MNIALWAAQVILATSFVWSAYKKLFQTEQLSDMWPWVRDNQGLAKLTALPDFLAGVGLVLPGLLRIRPELTIYAAYGTIALMIAATGFHITRGEGALIGPNIFFAVFAAFIAWGRSKYN